MSIAGACAEIRARVSGNSFLSITGRGLRSSGWEVAECKPSGICHVRRKHREENGKAKNSNTHSLILLPDRPAYIRILRTDSWVLGGVDSENKNQYSKIGQIYTNFIKNRRENLEYLFEFFGVVFYT